MGKGAPDNSEAIALQKESLAESKIQNKQMLALLQSQVDAAKTLKLPKQAPPAALPDTSSSDMIAQSQETRRNLMKRNGLLQTRLVQPVATLRSAMGTPMMAAA